MWEHRNEPAWVLVLGIRSLRNRQALHCTRNEVGHSGDRAWLCLRTPGVTSPHGSPRPLPPVFFSFAFPLSAPLGLSLLTQSFLSERHLTFIHDSMLHRCLDVDIIGVKWSAISHPPFPIHFMCNWHRIQDGIYLPVAHGNTFERRYDSGWTCPLGHRPGVQ